MNNEEKALEIQHNDPCCVWNNGCPNVRGGALKMAQWKDEQLDSAIDKALQRNGDFLKQGKITQYGYDMAFVTIQNIREYLKNQQSEHNTTKTD